MYKREKRDFRLVCATDCTSASWAIPIVDESFKQREIVSNSELCRKGVPNFGTEVHERIQSKLSCSAARHKSSVIRTGDNQVMKKIWGREMYDLKHFNS